MDEAAALLPAWIPFLLPPCWFLFTAIVTFAFGALALLVFGGMWRLDAAATIAVRARRARWRRALLVPSMFVVPAIGLLGVGFFLGPFTAPWIVMALVTIAGGALGVLCAKWLVERRRGPWLTLRRYLAGCLAWWLVKWLGAWKWATRLGLAWFDPVLEGAPAALVLRGHRSAVFVAGRRPPQVVVTERALAVLDPSELRAAIERAVAHAAEPPWFESIVGPERSKVDADELECRERPSAVQWLLAIVPMFVVYVGTLYGAMEVGRQLVWIRWGLPRIVDQRQSEGLAHFDLAIGGGRETLCELGLWRLETRPAESLALFRAAEECGGNAWWALACQARALVRLERVPEARTCIGESLRLYADGGIFEYGSDGPFPDFAESEVKAAEQALAESSRDRK